MFKPTGVKALQQLSQPGLTAILAASFALAFSSCGSQQVESKPKPVAHQQPQSKRSAFLAANGKAYAPPEAPYRVHLMVAAANELVTKPYRFGGGHASFHDSGYDCSGSTSYVLHKGGLLNSPVPSGTFLNYGRAGYGNYVNIYARNGHVFLELCGLRFDTGGTNTSTGPRWKPERRGMNGYSVRHPIGF